MAAMGESESGLFSLASISEDVEHDDVDGGIALSTSSNIFCPGMPIKCSVSISKEWLFEMVIVGSPTNQVGGG